MTNSLSENKLPFIQINDDLAHHINDKANELWHLLRNFDTANFESHDYFKTYFNKHHLGNRLFFSLESSARILYDGVKRTGKPVNQITLVDYGGGLGTLFMLGGLMGFKQVIYNDYLPQWCEVARLLSAKLKIDIADFIDGDYTPMIAYATARNITIDLVVSRNVIEHIYNLPVFFSSLYRYNPAMVVHSTTTANYHNPAMLLFHIWVHKRIDKKFHLVKRTEVIQKMHPELSMSDLKTLGKLTRGKALQDFTEAIQDYIHKRPVKPTPYLRSNTCDHETGVWAEHILTRKEYADIINGAGFKLDYYGGFWDTHYGNRPLNWLTKIFNIIIGTLGKKGYYLSPFVNIVAYK